MGRNDDSSSSSEAGRTFARPARASRVLRGGRIVAEACQPLHQAPMASGDSSSLYPFNSRKDTNNQAQGTVALRHGGPDVLSGPAAGAPSSSWMSWSVPRDFRDTRDEGVRHQAAASSSFQSLQRSPGALDLTKGAGTSERAVNNPPKRKLSKSFPKDWAEPEVDDALPMDVVGNRQVVVGAAPTKKKALKRVRQYERLVRALQHLNITDAVEKPGRARTRKGALKMELDSAEGTSGQGGVRQTASEQGKESKRRSKGQKKKVKRASSADAVMARAQKEKEATKKPRGAGGKQRQSDGQQKKPKTDPPKAGKKPTSGPSTCSGGGKSKRPRRTTSDPGSPSFVKLKSYVHLR